MISCLRRCIADSTIRVYLDSMTDKVVSSRNHICHSSTKKVLDFGRHRQLLNLTPNSTVRRLRYNVHPFIATSNIVYSVCVGEPIPSITITPRIKRNLEHTISISAVEHISHKIIILSSLIRNHKTTLMSYAKVSGRLVVMKPLTQSDNQGAEPIIMLCPFPT